MAESKLDQVVKGVPPPNVSKQQVAAAVVSRSSSPESAADLLDAKKPTLAPPADPTTLLPSSPPQIYLNLLILEASLRLQYLTLHNRRRQHVFFLNILGLWNVYFFYALFLRPREDGSGHGGSVYWVVDMTEKVAFMGGIVTAMLIWGTGQWERGVRWPRRWVGITNRGLRGMNLKIVLLKGAWWRQMLHHMAIIFPYGSFFPVQGSSYHMIDYAEKRDANDHRRRNMREEDIAPGGDMVKLLLLPKAFSSEFRENWELYRTEYWERENERRAELRKIVKKRQRESAQQEGVWFWWMGNRSWRKTDEHAGDPEKHALHAHRLSREIKRRRESIISRENHSRSSSRSSVTSNLELEDSRGGTDRASRAARKMKLTTTTPTIQLKQSQRRRTTEMHGETVYVDPSPRLSKRSSTLSNASSSTNDSEQSDRSSGKMRHRDLAMSNLANE